MRTIIKIIIGVILVFGSFFLIYNLTGKKEVIPLPYLLENEKVAVDKYYTYGTSLNLYGSIMIDYEYESISLFMYDEMEHDIPIIINKEDNIIKFKLTDLVNKGLYLDDLEIGYYYLVLKVVIDEDNIKYYALENNTDYDSTVYYTMSSYHKMITIDTDNVYKTMSMDVVDKTDVRTDVYDVVIDAGHGGYDPGAVDGSKKEKDVNLALALKVRDKLENVGLRVFMLRDEDIGFKNYNLNDMIGRVPLIGSSNAKYVFSIHLNSNLSKSVNGVEVYTAYNIDYSLARGIADSIVNMTDSTYSSNMLYKMYNGVYTRTMDDSNLKNNLNDASEGGYEPYSIDKNTVYYFVIRELGGIVTNAHVDGRDKAVGSNPYYNSNTGIEGYLLEVGYLSNNIDYNNITNNINLYADAISKGIIEGIKR